MRSKIQKAGPIPANLQPLAKGHDQIADLFSKGLGVDSDSILAERLPDGRVRFHLNPELLSQLKLPPRFAVPPIPVSADEIATGDVTYDNAGAPALIKVLFMSEWTGG